MKKKTIVLIGTLDTKREEIYFIEKLIKKKGIYGAISSIRLETAAKKGPVKVFIPTKGFCEPDKEGSDLFEPQGNQAFTESLKQNLNPTIPLVEVNAYTNDPEFVDLVTEAFIKMV